MLSDISSKKPRPRTCAPSDATPCKSWQYVWRHRLRSGWLAAKLDEPLRRKVATVENEPRRHRQASDPKNPAAKFAKSRGKRRPHELSVAAGITLLHQQLKPFASNGFRPCVHSTNLCRSVHPSCLGGWGNSAQASSVVLLSSFVLSEGSEKSLGTPACSEFGIFAVVVVEVLEFPLLYSIIQ